MNKLKFSKDEGSDFYKELNQRVELYFAEKGIPKSGNKKMIIKIILYFSLDILFYSLMMTSTTLLIFYTFYLLFGISILLTALNIAHDAAHGIAVRSKFWNKVLCSLSFILLGNNAYIWGKNHTESHHLYTNVEGSDTDILQNPLFRITESQPLKWFHRYQHIYAPFFYLFYSINWLLVRDISMSFDHSSKTIKLAIPKVEFVQLIFYKTLYIGFMILFPIYILPFDWHTILLGFFGTHCIVSLIFIAFLGVSHLSEYVYHPVPDEHNKLNISWPKLQMCSSIDYNADSVFFHWTLGGFNVHILHHLLPNICHIHFLDILPIFRALAHKHGLTYMEMPYRKSLAAHFRFLKKMGTQVAIQTTPFVSKL